MQPVIALFFLVGLTLGLPEKPAPYPAKGWKPQGARLELPIRQYGVPKTAMESVEFTTLTNEYLEPTTTLQNDEEDLLSVQGLPRADAVSQFNNVNVQETNVKARQPQVARIRMAPAPAFIGHPFLLSPLFAPQFAPTNGQLQERQFGQQQQQQQQQQQEFNSPKNDAQQLPAQAYGPPQSNNKVPEVTTEQPEDQRREEPNPIQPESGDDYDDDQAESEEPIVAISNAEATGNLVQTQQGQVGQYYILLPDNSLQKVRFATKQTTEDRQINGFSAQLRYSPVEAIKDPVYGYDEQGKLVRLYK